jgi:hypothetical protein
VIAALLRALRGQPAATTSRGHVDEDSPAFVRGLALGAFVGAAIAGSTLWRRFQARSGGAGAAQDSGTETTLPE